MPSSHPAGRWIWDYSSRILKLEPLVLLNSEAASVVGRMGGLFSLQSSSAEKNCVERGVAKKPQKICLRLEYFKNSSK